MEEEIGKDRSYSSMVNMHSTLALMTLISMIRMLGPYPSTTSSNFLQRNWNPKKEASKEASFFSVTKTGVELFISTFVFYLAAWTISTWP